MNGAMRNLDLRQLRYFVTVAEELSFSRAAARLHMSQPPLSQQIKSLETEMGVALFLRNRREVQLTHAGGVFLDECRVLLDRLATAVNTAIHAGEGHAGTLRVGVATAGLFSVMPTFLALLRASHADVKVLVNDMQSDDQINAVAQGALDIGIVHTRAEKTTLPRALVFEDHLALVLPASHRSAGQPTVALRDIAADAMVSLSRPHAPSIFDAVIAACAHAGFSPRIEHTARSVFTICQMVAMGFGVAVVPASYAPFTYPGVVLRPLADAGSALLRMEMVWSDRPTRALAREVAQSLAPRLAQALAAQADAVLARPSTTRTMAG